jgi:hypothetical protein
VAENLVFETMFRPEGKGHGFFVPWLGHEVLPTDGILIKAHRGSCFQPKHRKTETFQTLSEFDGSRLVGPAGRVALESDVNDSIEEGPRAQYNGPAAEDRSVQGFDSLDNAFADKDFGNDPLKQGQILDFLEEVFHSQSVPLLVALGPGRLDGPSPAPVEEFEVDPGIIGQEPHDSAQGIDLPDKMALRQAADGRVAGHLGDCFEMDRDQAGIEPHGANRGRRFAARVPGTDDDDIEYPRFGHLFLIFRRKSGRRFRS